MTEEEDEQERRRRIIIRTAAESSALTLDERAFLTTMLAGMDAGASVHLLDRLRVDRLVDRVLFG